MTVRELSEALSLKPLTDDIGMDNEVMDCYIGDLLSWVMGRAPQHSVWITVMGNINAVAVAQLADISCILLSESAPLDESAKAQAKLLEIPILSGEKPSYTLALGVAALLGHAVLPQ